MHDRGIRKLGIGDNFHAETEIPCVRNLCQPQPKSGRDELCPYTMKMGCSMKKYSVDLNEGRSVPRTPWLFIKCVFLIV